LQGFYLALEVKMQAEEEAQEEVEVLVDHQKVTL
jgi:hypothetical protein